MNFMMIGEKKMSDFKVKGKWGRDGSLDIEFETEDEATQFFERLEKQGITAEEINLMVDFAFQPHKELLTHPMHRYLAPGPLLERWIAEELGREHVGEYQKVVVREGHGIEQAWYSAWMNDDLPDRKDRVLEWTDEHEFRYWDPELSRSRPIPAYTRNIGFAMADLWEELPAPRMVYESDLFGWGAMCGIREGFYRPGEEEPEYTTRIVNIPLESSAHAVSLLYWLYKKGKKADPFTYPHPATDGKVWWRRPSYYVSGPGKQVWECAFCPYRETDFEHYGEVGYECPECGAVFIGQDSFGVWQAKEVPIEWAEGREEAWI